MDEDLYRLVPSNPNFQQEFFEAEYYARYYYLMRKVAEDRDRILRTEESKRQLDEAIESHNFSVGRLTDELTLFVLRRTN